MVDQIRVFRQHPYTFAVNKALQVSIQQKISDGRSARLTLARVAARCKRPQDIQRKQTVALQKEEEIQTGFMIVRLTSNQIQRRAFHLQVFESVLLIFVVHVLILLRNYESLQIF